MVNVKNAAKPASRSAGRAVSKSKKVPILRVRAIAALTGDGLLGVMTNKKQQKQSEERAEEVTRLVGFMTSNKRTGTAIPPDIKVKG